MYLKIDTEVERFEFVFKGFERPFTFQIIWKRIPNFRRSVGETFCNSRFRFSVKRCLLLMLEGYNMTCQCSLRTNKTGETVNWKTVNWCHAVNNFKHHQSFVFISSLLKV